MIETNRRFDVLRRVETCRQQKYGQRLSTPAALVVFAAFALLGGACSGDDDTDASAPETDLANLTVVADGFERPTQIGAGPDGRLLVAQLNGDEQAAAGQVIDLDVQSGQREVLLEGLDKPTGVLWLDDTLWVMQRRSLAKASWDGTGDVGELEVVLDGLPWNGRSEGTLTALDDGRILYATTGGISDGAVDDGSGVLWALDPSTGESDPVSVGVKNAYAHVEADGEIVTTEIGDNVADPPDDEIQILPLGSPAAPADAGWPDCPPPASCDGVIAPLATFPAGATPTGVAVVGDRVVVALFVTGSLVQVDRGGWVPSDPPREATLLVDDLDGPHTVIDRGDGILWVSEHGTGRILAITI